MKLIRPLDIIIVLLLLSAGTVSFFLIRGEQGARAEVYVDNRRVAVFSLSGPEQLKEIPTRIGNVQLAVGGGAIRVVKSPCTQKICVLQGRIRHTHEKIVCLPAQLVVTIVDPDKTEPAHGDVDAVSY